PSLQLVAKTIGLPLERVEVSGGVGIARKDTRIAAGVGTGGAVAPHRAGVSGNRGGQTPRGFPPPPDGFTGGGNDCGGTRGFCGFGLACARSWRCAAGCFDYISSRARRLRRHDPRVDGAYPAQRRSLRLRSARRHPHFGGPTEDCSALGLGLSWLCKPG